MFDDHDLIFLFLQFSLTLRSLSKTAWQLLRERHQRKGLMKKTIAVLVHYKSWYISLPSYAKQEREMTKFYVVMRNANDGG